MNRRQRKRQQHFYWKNHRPRNRGTVEDRTGYEPKTLTITGINRKMRRDDPFVYEKWQERNRGFIEDQRRQAELDSDGHADQSVQADSGDVIQPE